LAVARSTTVWPARARSRRQPRSFEKLADVRVDLDPGHHLFVADAATRILVHLLDQLLDRVHAVADDMGGDALGDRDQLAVDHQDAVVVALEELLDDDVAALGLAQRLVEAEAELLFRSDADRDAAAVIAVERLGDERVAQPARLPHRLLGRAHDDAARHRDAVVVEQLLGLILVARDIDRDQRGPPVMLARMRC
jgi:hypothetical protein